MRHVRVLFLIFLLGLLHQAFGGEPYAFRIVSNFQVEDKIYSGHGLGVPVEVDGKKLILTAYHVAMRDDKGANEILVNLPQGYIRCKGVKAWPKFDLLLLKPAIEPPFVIGLSEKMPEKGQEVMNPNFFASKKLTIKKGRVGDNIGPLWLATIDGFAHGSSGSPVLDKDGRLVGLATHGISTDDGKTFSQALFVGKNLVKEFFEIKPPK